MKSALYLIYVLNCFFLILTVLLQAGRGGGMALMGSGGGGGGSATMFGNRGATTFIQKMTIGAAVSFMSLSILLAFTSMASSSGDRGVIISEEERNAHMISSDGPIEEISDENEEVIPAVEEQPILIPESGLPPEFILPNLELTPPNLELTPGSSEETGIIPIFSDVSSDEENVNEENSEELE